MDKLQQHRCEGFLLATSTTASTALKEKLDKLDIANGGSVQTKVWDRFELTRLLLSERFSDLLVQFFPKQSARNAVQQIDAARERIETTLPRFVAGRVRSCLISHKDRIDCLSGARVWPHDVDQQNKIDTLRIFVTRSPGRRALDLLEELDFDVFIAYIDQVIRNYPAHAKALLVSFAKDTKDNAKLFNSIEILREEDDFTLTDEILITQRCDGETLYELYNDTIHQDLGDASVWEDRLPWDLRRIGEEVSVTDANVEDIQFSGGDGIGFEATVSLSIECLTHDNEGAYAGHQTFTRSVTATGYLSGGGAEIEDVR